MKTNHQRGFIESSAKPRRYSAPAGVSKRSIFADVSKGGSYGGDACNGHRGYAKAKRGAKKFARSRIRFHENATMIKEIP